MAIGDGREGRGTVVTRKGDTLLTILTAVSVKEMFRASCLRMYYLPDTSVPGYTYPCDSLTRKLLPWHWCLLFQVMPLSLVRPSRTPSAFQVSPYEDQPCRPCDCDPVGSLSAVCIKDDLHSDLANGKILVCYYMRS